MLSELGFTWSSGGSSAIIGLLTVFLQRFWELGSAIKHSSQLPDRQFLGDEMKKLGDLTRNTQDKIIKVNSQGLATFTSIL